jgi:hypothetical protein
MELAEKAIAQSFANQVTLMALVMTHPNPGAFAQTLEALIAHTQAEWAAVGLVSPDARATAQSLFDELLDIARHEAERRT